MSQNTVRYSLCEAYFYIINAYKSYRSFKQTRVCAFFLMRLSKPFSQIFALEVFPFLFPKEVKFRALDGTLIFEILQGHTLSVFFQ